MDSKRHAGAGCGRTTSRDALAGRSGYSGYGFGSTGNTCVRAGIGACLRARPVAAGYCADSQSTTGKSPAFKPVHAWYRLSRGRGGIASPGTRRRADGRGDVIGRNQCGAGAHHVRRLERPADTAELCPRRGPAVRGQIIVLNAPPGLVRRIVLFRGDYLIPRKDGRGLVGSTLEVSGFDKATTAAAREDLWTKATTWAPALRNYPIEYHWSGLRPGSPAGIPYVGEHPELRGLFLNTGHFRCGLALGPASARLAADLMLQRQPILAPEAYSVGAARSEQGSGAHLHDPPSPPCGCHGHRLCLHAGLDRPN